MDRTQKEHAEHLGTTIPRWMDYTPGCKLQLHVFTDAGRRALASSVYFRVSAEDESVSTLLLDVKTKLSPIRSLLLSAQPAVRMTIPRLRAALLGVRLLRIQVDALRVEFKDWFAWSDSQIVIQWFSSNNPMGNDLVENYINHIQDLLPDVTWLYVSTNHKIADVTMRGTDTDRLSIDKLWWQGPVWLRQATKTWPNSSPCNQQETSPYIVAPVQCLTS